MTTEPTCELCHRPISEHVIFHSEEPRDRDHLVEGVFGVPTSGFYCPNGAS